MKPFINYALLNNRARMVCADCGLDYGVPYVRNEGDDRHKAVVDRVFLQKGPKRGQWRLAQITGASGGERDLSGVLSAREMLAFIEGMELATRCMREAQARVAEQIQARLALATL